MAVLIGGTFDDEPVVRLVESGPATGVFNLTSQLGAPAAPLLAPPLASIAPAPGKAVTLTDTSKVPLTTLLRPFITWTDGDTTPSVLNGQNFKTANTGATTITTFDEGREGQRILIVFTDANTTVSEASNIRLSAAFTSTADDTMELVYDGSVWFELGRSVN